MPNTDVSTNPNQSHPRLESVVAGIESFLGLIPSQMLDQASTVDRLHSIIENWPRAMESLEARQAYVPGSPENLALGNFAAFVSYTDFILKRNGNVSDTLRLLDANCTFPSSEVDVLKGFTSTLREQEIIETQRSLIIRQQLSQQQEHLENVTPEKALQSICHKTKPLEPANLKRFETNDRDGLDTMGVDFSASGNLKVHSLGQGVSSSSPCGTIVKDSPTFSKYLPVHEAYVFVREDGSYVSLMALVQEVARISGSDPHLEALFPLKEVPVENGTPRGASCAVAFPVMDERCILPLSPRFQVQSVGFFDQNGEPIANQNTTVITQPFYGSCHVSVPPQTAQVQLNLTERPKGSHLSAKSFAALASIVPALTLELLPDEQKLISLISPGPDQGASLSSVITHSTAANFAYSDNPALNSLYEAAHLRLSTVLNNVGIAKCDYLSFQASRINQLGEIVIMTCGPTIDKPYLAYNPGHAQALRIHREGLEIMDLTTNTETIPSGNFDREGIQEKFDSIKVLHDERKDDQQLIAACRDLKRCLTETGSGGHQEGNRPRSAGHHFISESDAHDATNLQAKVDVQKLSEMLATTSDNSSAHRGLAYFYQRFPTPITRGFDEAVSVIERAYIARSCLPKGRGGLDPIIKKEMEELIINHGFKDKDNYPYYESPRYLRRAPRKILLKLAEHHPPRRVSIRYRDTDAHLAESVRLAEKECLGPMRVIEALAAKKIDIDKLPAAKKILGGVVGIWRDTLSDSETEPDSIEGQIKRRSITMLTETLPQVLPDSFRQVLGEVLASSSNTNFRSLPAEENSLKRIFDEATMAHWELKLIENPFDGPAIAAIRALKGTTADLSSVISKSGDVLASSVRRKYQDLLKKQGQTFARIVHGYERSRTRTFEIKNVLHNPPGMGRHASNLVTALCETELSQAHERLVEIEQITGITGRLTAAAPQFSEKLVARNVADRVRAMQIHDVPHLQLKDSGACYLGMSERSESTIDCMTIESLATKCFGPVPEEAMSLLRLTNSFNRERTAAWDDFVVSFPDEAQIINQKIAELGTDTSVSNIVAQSIIHRIPDDEVYPALIWAKTLQFYMSREDPHFSFKKALDTLLTEYNRDPSKEPNELLALLFPQVRYAVGSSISAECKIAMLVGLASMKGGQQSDFLEFRSIALSVSQLNTKGNDTFMDSLFALAPYNQVAAQARTEELFKKWQTPTVEQEPFSTLGQHSRALTMFQHQKSREISGIRTGLQSDGFRLQEVNWRKAAEIWSRGSATSEIVLKDYEPESSIQRVKIVVSAESTLYRGEMDQLFEELKGCESLLSRNLIDSYEVIISVRGDSTTCRFDRTSSMFDDKKAQDLFSVLSKKELQIGALRSSESGGGGATHEWTFPILTSVDQSFGSNDLVIIIGDKKHILETAEVVAQIDNTCAGIEVLTLD